MLGYSCCKAPSLALILLKTACRLQCLRAFGGGVEDTVLTRMAKWYHSIHLAKAISSESDFLTRKESEAARVARSPIEF